MSDSLTDILRCAVANWLIIKNTDICFWDPMSSWKDRFVFYSSVLGEVAAVIRVVISC